MGNALNRFKTLCKPVQKAYYLIGFLLTPLKGQCVFSVVLDLQTFNWLVY